MDPQQSQGGQDDADQDASLLDLLIVLAKWKRVVAGVPLAVALVSVVLGFALPSYYTGRATVMPPQQSQSNVFSTLGQLGILTGSTSTALGLKNPSDIYVTMLKARTVADELVRRFDLQKLYSEEYLADARRVLARRTQIVVDRTGVISIEVEDRDPKRAAEIANAYVDELGKLTLNLAVGEAGQRRLFFEQQLKKAKDDLTNAEAELTKFKLAKGIISPLDQAGLTVSASAALRAQVAAKEVQLAAAKSFATEQNPDIVQLQNEIGGLRTQLAKLDKNSSRSEGDLVVPISKAPATAEEYVRKFREFRYNEVLFELLARQYESAKLDEAKNATVIQVLDRAVPPEKRSSPKRLVMLAVGIFLGAVAGVVAAFVLEARERMLRDPETAARWAELRRLVSLRWVSRWL